MAEQAGNYICVTAPRYVAQIVGFYYFAACEQARIEEDRPGFFGETRVLKQESSGVAVSLKERLYEPTKASPNVDNIGKDRKVVRAQHVPAMPRCDRVPCPLAVTIGHQRPVSSGKRSSVCPQYPKPSWR
jgi:hypothetical protein